MSPPRARNRFRLIQSMSEFEGAFEFDSDVAGEGEASFAFSNGAKLDAVGLEEVGPGFEGVGNGESDAGVGVGPDGVEVDGPAGEQEGVDFAGGGGFGSARARGFAPRSGGRLAGASYGVAD